MGTAQHHHEQNGKKNNGIVYELEMMEMMIEDDKKDSNQDLLPIHLKNTSDDDDFWHELQLSRKLVIKGKIDEYINSFTVHGLTKVFTGTKIESVFWATMLLSGIVLSTVIVHGLVSKFLEFGMYTEIRSQITDQNYFPSVTICENRLLIDTYFAYCGVPARKEHPLHNISCQHHYIMPPENISTKKNYFWGNGVFNVTRCVGWGGKNCASSDNFKSLRHFNHSCIRWNYNGDLHDIYSHVEIDFTFETPDRLDIPPEIIAVPHDPDIHEIDVTNKVDIEPYKYYEIKLDKTVTKRLPSPYPSNCTIKKSGDIFPGKYTRRSCIESHNYIEMFKKCGDTLDYVKQFIPQDIKKKYARNRTIDEAEVCIWYFGKGEAIRTKDCAFPCEDLDLGVMASFHERTKVNRSSVPTYHVIIQLQRVDTYKIMEEKELYSWSQMACEIGGLIGLVIGASVISFIEILAYISLVIANKCF